MNINGSLSLSTSILAIYMICWHSPKQMSSYKWYLLNIVVSYLKLVFSNDTRITIFAPKMLGFYKLSYSITQKINQSTLLQIWSCVFDVYLGLLYAPQITLPTIGICTNGLLKAYVDHRCLVVSFVSLLNMPKFQKTIKIFSFCLSGFLDVWEFLCRWLSSTVGTLSLTQRESCIDLELWHSWPSSKLYSPFRLHCPFCTGFIMIITRF